MSRWTNSKYHDFKTNSGDYWNAPKNHYIITADGDRFEVDFYRLDYKNAVQNLRRLGYNKINIVCVGKNVTF